AGPEVEEQYGHQEERGAGHREQEELDGRVHAPLAPPPADDQIHGEQQCLEEEEEEQEVQREERTDHRGLEDQERDQVVLRLPFHLPRHQDGRRHQERREQDHEQ